MGSIINTMLDLSTRTNPDNEELIYEIHENYKDGAIAKYKSALHPIDFCVVALYKLGYHSYHKIFVNRNGKKELIFAYGYIE